MPKPISISYGELEHVLYLLENNATPHAKADFEAILERVAEEPRDILKKNRHLSASDVEQIDQIRTLKAAYEWRSMFGGTVRSKRGGGYIPFLNVLEKAAADLLVSIYSLSGIPAEWLTATWEQESPAFERALLLFLHHRDAGEADSVRERRHKGGEHRGKSLIERNKKIRREAKALLEDHPPHEISGILARKYRRTPARIRQILREQGLSVTRMRQILKKAETS